MVSSTDIIKTLREVSFGEVAQELSFGQIRFEMSIKHPNRDVE